MFFQAFRGRMASYPLTAVINSIALLFMVTLLGSCVSSSTYDEVSQERDALLKRQTTLEGNIKYLRNKNELSEQEAAQLEVKLAGVKKSLSEASKQLDEKNTQLSMTSEELSDRRAELQETERKLAKSNQQLQATTAYMEKTNKIYNDLVGKLKTEVKANQIKISEMKDGITVNLSQEILFPSGSAILSPEGIDVIKKVSGSLKNIPHQIIVAGFTDNVPIKGDLAKIYPSNWELAGARAASVVRLLESEGVDSDKLTAVSYGENKPVASNDNWKSRRKNRRIEIRLRPVE
jgi:chemotaxis protein MotB